MPASMPGQERDFPARQLAHDIGVRWRAPRRVDGAFFVTFKSRHGVESAAADDANTFGFILV